MEALNNQIFSISNYIRYVAIYADDNSFPEKSRA
jgi:hypothetical protein